MVGRDLPSWTILTRPPLAVLDTHFVHIEVDGAHDAVAELLVDEGLYGRPVILGYLVMRSIVGPVGASDPPRRPAPGCHADWTPPTRRLRAVGTGYLRFARAEPGLLRTAFSASDNLRSAASPARAGGGGLTHFQLLGVALDGLVETGVLPRGRRPGTEFLAWPAVHGLAMLPIDGPCAASTPPGQTRSGGA